MAEIASVVFVSIHRIGGELVGAAEADGSHQMLETEATFDKILSQSIEQWIVGGGV